MPSTSGLVFDFARLQSRVLTWIDENVATNSQTLALVKDGLNASHRRVLMSRRWPWLIWPKEQSFTTVAGTRVYALHPSVGKILHVWDPARHFFLPFVPRRQWENLAVDRSISATTPAGLSMGAIWPVQFQPNGSGLSVTSSDVGDTAVSVTIFGTDVNDEPLQETITATGTSPATSMNAFNLITNVTKTGVWRGTLTLKAGTQTILTLGPSEVGRQYQTVEFVENPAGGLVFTYAFSRPPDALEADTDLPNIYPNDFAEILVYDTLLDLSTYNTELGLKEQTLWKARYDALEKQMIEATDENILGAYPRFVRDLTGDGFLRRVLTT